MQQEKLIESIYLGYPIGSLLCFRTGEKHQTVEHRNRDVIELVDGLQRTSTILSFLKAPLLTAPVRESIDPDNLDQISDILKGYWQTTTQEAITKAIEEWMRSCETTEAARGFDGYGLFESLSKLKTEEDQVVNYEQVRQPVSAILDDIRNSVQAIREVRIPIVVYSGDVGNVPEIFQRVNSQGTKLTKYEIYAASWMNFSARIDNDKIRQAIRNKYLQLIDEGYEVSGFDEQKLGLDDEFNLYEYLFGLGHVLCSDFPILFPEVGSPDEATSVGFNVVTVAMGLRINDMNSLATHLRELKLGNPLDLSKLEKSILVSCGEVENLLRPYLSLKLNNQGGKTRFLPHSQNQIISLITRYMTAKYDYTTWELTNSNEVEILKKNIPAYYLYDMVREIWRGSGDSHLWNMCWSGTAPKPGNLAEAKSDFYLQAIPAERWRMALTSWHDEQLGKRQKLRPNLNDKTRAVLKFVYSPIVSHFDNQANEFDLEHLYPVDVLQGLIGQDPDDGWPISATGNLSLLPKEINRIKGKTMLGDYLAQSGVETSEEEFERLSKYVITPEISQLKISPGLDRDAYIDFCRQRFEELISRLISQLS